MLKQLLACGELKVKSKTWSMVYKFFLVLSQLEKDAKCVAISTSPDAYLDPSRT